MGNFRLSLLVSTALFAGLASFDGAAAQSLPTPEPAAGDASASPVRGSADAELDIVVTARRVEEKAQDIPVAVTAISAASLDRLTIREARDLSSVAPNLNIKESSNDPQGALISLRGQTQAGILLTTDSSVGLYTDGINNPRSQGLRGALVDISRIEVLRGPQGTLYGRNTTGGAISILSNSPRDEFGASARVRYGNYNAVDLLGVVNIPLSENVATRFVVQHASHDGYGHDNLGRDLNDQDSTYLRGKLRGDFGAFKAEFTGEYSTYNSGGAIVRLSGLVPATGTTVAGGTAAREAAIELGFGTTPVGLAAASAYLASYVYPGSVPGATSVYDAGGGVIGSYSQVKSYFAAADLSYDISDHWTLRSLTGYREFRRSSREEIDGTPLEILSTVYMPNDRFYSEELQALGHYDKLDIVAGVFGSKEDGRDGNITNAIRSILASSTVVDGDVSSKSVAAFAQINWHFTNKLTLTVGGRYTSEKKGLVTRNRNSLGVCTIPTSLLDVPGVCQATLSKTYSDPSWLVSLDYKVNDDVLVYGKYSRGIRAGGQNLRGANTVVLFAAFDPEYVDEFEAGLKSDLFDKRLRLNLAGFYDNYRNVQRTVIVNGGTGTLVSNAAKATIYGFEVEATARPVEGLTLNATLGYTHARYDEFIDATGNRTNEDWPTPDFQYALSARYAHGTSLGEFSAQIDYQGQSAQNLYPSGKLVSQTTQDAYGLLNGKITLAMNGGAELSVFGRNLTNKTYAVGALNIESLGYNLKFLGEPRVYGLELAIKFGGER